VKFVNPMCMEPFWGQTGHYWNFCCAKPRMVGLSDYQMVKKFMPMMCLCLN